ncbi:hypothetical protein BG003_007105 [Podila horticola]|nr:hypothetical protein BG003_007105 [Podila horticola]
MNLEKQEQKVIMDTKRAAKAGYMIMAMDLIQTRRPVQKLYQMKTPLQGVGIRIQAICAMEKNMNLPRIQQTIMKFEKKSEILDMRVRSSMGEEGDEEEEDVIVGQVLDQIGIDIMVPRSLRMAIKSPLEQSHERIPVAVGGIHDDGEYAALQAPLDSLRRE